jgi:serine/threonine protein kinase
MSEILRPGQAVYTASQHQPITIAKFIAGGGQGEVYRADFSGQPVAVKWYFANYPEQDKLRTRLRDLIGIGSPSERFLWPFGLVESPGVPAFGYVMPLAAMPPFQSLPAIWSQEPRPSMHVLATTGMNLAHCFMQVHSQGLCYRDISDGNIFFDSGSGEVLIADNDNVSVKDVACEVAGTRGYMAPEVVRREASPSRMTDLHSLAVVLFQILMVQHPLVGKRELEMPLHIGSNHSIYYGSSPVFIFDPVDKSNELLPGYREYEAALYYWPIYPQFVRDAFTQAFTIGLRDPDSRVGDAEWRREFARLRDCIFYCPGCGEECFLDGDAVRAAGGKMAPCRHCGGVPPIPPYIRIGKNRVVLNPDTRLYPHHIDTRRPFDFSQPVAAVSAGPPEALQNLSTQKWVMRTSEGSTSDILPGAIVPLADRSTINFGTLEGVVRL